MNGHGMNENEFRELLGSAIGEEPPIVGGPAAVFAGARSRVVRTRAVAGALSVVAVLGVAAGAVAFAGGSGGGAQVGAAASGGGSGKQPAVGDGLTPGRNVEQAASPGARKEIGGSGADGPLPATPAPKPGPGQVLLDGRSALDLLKRQLPAGTTTGDYVVQNSFEPEKMGVSVYGGLSVDDGSHHLTAVSVNVQQNSPVSYADTTCAAMLSGDRLASECHEFPQPDRSRVLVLREDVPPQTEGGAPTGAYQYIAYRLFPDGMRISVGADNCDTLASGPKKTSPTRSTPLLSMDQLKAIVLDQHWTLTVSAEFAQQARKDIQPVVDLTQKDSTTK